MHGNENKVCKLIKSLYGLKQAPKQWHLKFDEVVLSSGYLLNQADKCVYIKFDKLVDLTKEFFSSRFFMMDMGEADVILGIRIKHESNRIAISQSHYIKKVLKKFNYFDCTPVSTPMDTSEKLMSDNGQAISQLEYSRVVGYLMQAIYWILKYLKKTIYYSLIYIGYPSVLEEYTDASWINNTKDNSFTSGWVFLLVAGKEVEWLRNLILEIPLWSKPIASISIHCDSDATLAKAYS
ncbi:zinc finger, CCHC-type containing protein [Tanacetum coccineum]|uniref:Zinc finger, CCHC-type containing protein n=1 Tax=Tanacetum coccineum TaxID=301880 RepID=A0ABQ4XS61_9ASTR